jgi:hypothetical protein
MKYIKHYIDFNNYEEEKGKKRPFSIDDSITPIGNHVFWYNHNYKQWSKDFLNKDNEYKIRYIKNCHEYNSNDKRDYIVPCDKGEWLIIINGHWPWYSSNFFKKVKKKWRF